MVPGHILFGMQFANKKKAMLLWQPKKHEVDEQSKNITTIELEIQVTFLQVDAIFYTYDLQQLARNSGQEIECFQTM